MTHSMSEFVIISTNQSSFQTCLQLLQHLLNFMSCFLCMGGFLPSAAKQAVMAAAPSLLFPVLCFSPFPAISDYLPP